MARFLVSKVQTAESDFFEVTTSMSQLSSKLKRIDWNEVMNLFMLSIPFFPGVVIINLVKELQNSPLKLNEKVNRAVESIRIASLLVADLERELSSKLEQVEKLKTEYERYQQLATVEEQKARAFIQEMQQLVIASQRRERLVALAINILAGIVVFVVGVWASPKIRLWFGIP